MKILIFGLPGSGKTAFATKLVAALDKPHKWYNGDKMREEHNDWDFSNDGRLRQSQRMAEAADECKRSGIVAVCDFVCPTEYLREVFSGDIVVWMDTIKAGRYPNTNRMFEEPRPRMFTFRITDHDQETEVVDKIKKLL